MRTVIKIFSIFWCATLFGWAGFSVYNVATDENSPFKSKDVQTALRKSLLDDCALHDELIHLYGGWVRYSGRRVCNGVIRHDDGLLTRRGLRLIGVDKESSAIIDLKNMVEGIGGKFLYVQFPMKMDLRGLLTPKGCPRDFSHQVVDDLLGRLDAAQVSYLDTRAIVDETPESVSRYFFKTDHHWNFDGAFKAYPTIARSFVKALDFDENVIEDYIKPEAWKRTKLPRKFLGYEGKRVGGLFADPEDLYYYLPTFETNIRKEIKAKNIDQTGSFEESVLNKNVFKKPNSIMEDGGYGIYNYNLGHIRYMNHQAPIEKHLLIAKDSFALPIVAWLSTIFTQIDMIDLRHYEELTFKEKLVELKPDLVAVMYNPGHVGKNQLWRFSAIEERPAGKSITCELIRSEDEVKITPGKSSYRNHRFKNRLIPGASYRLKASSVEVFAGNPQKVSVAIVDDNVPKVVNRKHLSLDGQNEWLFTIPKNKEECSLRLYAGEIGHTEDVGVVWRNVTLEQIQKR